MKLLLSLALVAAASSATLKLKDSSGSYCELSAASGFQASCDVTVGKYSLASIGATVDSLVADVAAIKTKLHLQHQQDLIHTADIAKKAQKGETGAKGAQGVQGIQGQKGQKGTHVVGAKGSTGAGPAQHRSP